MFKRELIIGVIAFIVLLIIEVLVAFGLVKYFTRKGDKEEDEE